MNDDSLIGFSGLLVVKIHHTRADANRRSAKMQPKKATTIDLAKRDGHDDRAAPIQRNACRPPPYGLANDSVHVVYLTLRAILRIGLELMEIYYEVE